MRKLLLTMIFGSLSMLATSQITIYEEDFEGASATTYQGSTGGAAITGLAGWEYTTSTGQGRLRTSAGAAYNNSGSRALTMDANPSGASPDPINTVDLTYDLSSYTTADFLELRFWAMHHGEESDVNDRCWIRGSNTDPWIQVATWNPAFTIFGGNGIYKEFVIDLSATLIANGQNFSSTTQVRWGQQDNFQSTSITASDGITIDDVSILNNVYSVNFVDGVFTPCFNDNNGSILAEAAFGAAPYTYLWSTGDTSALIESLMPGQYCVTATDNNGDTVSNCITLTPTDSIFTVASVLQQKVCAYDTTSAQAVGSGGDSIQEAYSMDTNSANYEWDSSGVLTTVTIPANAVTGPINIGFDFDFYGETQTSFQIAGNGYIGFGGDLTGGCCSGEPIPHNSGFEPSEAIFAAWFDVDGYQEYSYATVGVAPFRKLIVNFIGLGDNLGDDNYTGQIILHETTNCIEIQTAYMQYGGGYNVFDDVTQGITNDNSNMGQAFPGRNSDANGANGGWEADSSYVMYCPIDTTGLLMLWSNGVVGSTVFDLDPGTYTVSAIDANGCSGVDSVVINEPISDITVNPIVTDVSCFGFGDGSIDPGTTGASGAVDYVWSDLSTSNILQNLSGGLYAVTATDALGCVNEMDSIFVFEADLIITAINNVMPTDCPDSANGSASGVATGGVAPYTYTWQPSGLTGQSVTGLMAGDQQLQVVDANGCTSYKSVAITSLGVNPSVDLGPDQYLTDGGEVILDAGTHTAYQWSGGGSLATKTVTVTGEYSVTVTNEDGCKATDLVYIEIWPTGVEELDNSMLSVFPNPATYVINVQLNSGSVDNALLTITDINGKVVAVERGINLVTNQQTSISVESLAPGVYNLNVMGTELNSNFTFVKR